MCILHVISVSWNWLADGGRFTITNYSDMVFIILFGTSAFTGVFMSLDGNQLIASWISSIGIDKWCAFAINDAHRIYYGYVSWTGCGS